MFIIGPCALESKEQIESVLNLASKLNIKYIRAQLFKPRTHPKSFQGLREDGLHLLQLIHSRGFRCVTEILSLEHLKLVKDYISVIQIGSRNMQNFELLKSIGPYLHSTGMNKSDFPKIILKRGFANNIDELLGSALYLENNLFDKSKIIICERGTRSSVSPSNVVLDFNMALEISSKLKYKVIMDPSHGSKDSLKVLPLTKCIIALGYGVMLEVHPTPTKSLSDASQAIGLDDFESFANDFLKDSLK
jgi:3-deoxy-7-phosphoheptulonate synthase